MKRLLRAALAAGVLLGISTLALAATEGSPPSDCPKNCAHDVSAMTPPRAATPRLDAPSLGKKDAPVTVEVWSDFECPFCKRGANTIAQLRQQYGDKIRIVFRHSPLPFHKHARLAAAAAMAAHEQGHFWEFHDALFADQQHLDRPALEAVAQRLGLDMARFRASLDSKAWDSYVELELAEANHRGVQGTPTFFVNDQPIIGAQPLSEFTKVIDPALKR